MRECDAAMSDERPVQQLAELPPDCIAEIAHHVNGLRNFRSVLRFDMLAVAIARIQRWFRHVRFSRFSPDVHALRVGDRVCFRPWAIRRWAVPRVLPTMILFGTVDGEILIGLWKIRLERGSSAHVETRRVHRLSPWLSSGSQTDISIAVSHAVSTARGAAIVAAQAAQAVLQSSPLAASSSETVALRLSALPIAEAVANTASAATLVVAVAAAAPVAASALADTIPAAATPRNKLPAGGAALAGGPLVLEPRLRALDAHAAVAEAPDLLATMQTFPLHTDASGTLRRPPPPRPPHSDGELAPQETRDLLCAAAAAAAFASAEAVVATRAASIVCGVEPVTSLTTAAAAVASNLVTAAEALALHAAAVAETRGDAAVTLGPRFDPIAAPSDGLRVVTDAVGVMGSTADMAVAAAAAVAAMTIAQSTALDLAVTPPAAAPPFCPPADIDALFRDGSRSVLWCWLPHSEKWTIPELLERSTRAVSACRSADFLALPDLPAARELVEHWCATDYGPDRLNAENVIWFDPQPPLEACTDPDPAFTTLRHVLASYRERLCAAAAAAARSVSMRGAMARAALCCMYLDERAVSLAASYGLRSLGDLDAHPIVGKLSQAKSFLHPGLAQPARRPSLCNALLSAARGPRGFCCETGAELREAWTRLTVAHPGIRLVLKPAGGSGGNGVLLDVSRADVAAFADQMAAAAAAQEKAACVTACAGGEKAILEEMVGAPGQSSPTIYMVGRTVAVVADQLLTQCGTINLGNVSPAVKVDPPLMQAMSTACAELGAYLGLVGQWVS